MNKHKKFELKPKKKFLNQGKENTHILAINREKFFVGSLSILVLHLIFLFNDPKIFYSFYFKNICSFTILKDIFMHLMKLFEALEVVSKCHMKSRNA